MCKTHKRKKQQTLEVVVTNVLGKEHGGWEASWSLLSVMVTFHVNPNLQPSLFHHLLSTYGTFFKGRSTSFGTDLDYGKVVHGLIFSPRQGGVWGNGLYEWQDKKL